MVGVLIRMRLRLLRHALRGYTRAALFLTGAVIGLAAAGISAMLISVDLTAVLPVGAELDATRRLEIGTDITAALLAVWTLGWIVGPVFMGASDETLQPEHFRLLPLAPRRLATGLLVSSLVAVPPLVSLVAFSGLAFRGATFGALPAVVGVVGAVLQLALVLSLSRVVIGALGALMRSRRGQDLGVLLAAGVALLFIPAQYALNTLGPILLEGRSSAFTAVLRALPSGWSAVAVEAAARGNWALVAGVLGGLVVLVVLLGVLWSALLVRRMTASPSATSRGARAEVGGSRFLAGLPAGPVGAVAAKEMRTWWRDARRRSILLPSLLIGLALPVMPVLAGQMDSLGDIGMVPYTGAIVAAFACLNTGNLYGFDGTALWHTLVMPSAIRADVRGRQLAWLLIVGPVALLAAVVLPAMAARPETYPCVLGLVAALLGGGSGLVVLLSVFAAFPVPAQRTNPFAAGGLPGCGKVLLQMGLGLSLALLALPGIGLMLLGQSTGSMLVQWLAVPVGLGIGVLAWWWGGRLAIDRLAERGPELLDVVRPV